METKEWRNTDKSTWGPGPWQDEPDAMQWVDEATGLPCLIKRNRFGALCGYVGVSEGHPYFEKDAEKLDLTVHGGCTYSSLCYGEPGTGICHLPAKGEPDRVWWVGFDCAHAGDLCPEANYRKVLHGIDPLSTYKDVVYVKAEIQKLARQLRLIAAVAE